MALYAYVTAGNDSSLTIIDVTNPALPTIKGSIQGIGAPNWLQGACAVQVMGNYAYVTATDDHALTIIDVSNPAAPTFKGVIKGAGAPNWLQFASAVHVVGNYAYVAAPGIANSLTIIDISNPALPTFKGNIRGAGAPKWLSGPVGVYVVGDYAYVAASGDNALTIIDVSNPAAPTYKGSIKGAGAPNWLDTACAVHVVGDYAFVTALGNNALTIIDVSNPAAPTFKGVIKGAGAPNFLDNALAVYVVGDYAYVTATDDNALTIIDVSNPAAPTLAGSIQGAGFPNWLDGARGVWVGLSAPPAPPASVQTDPATPTLIAQNTARLNGELLDLGSALTVDVWFEYGLTPGGPYPFSTPHQTLTAPEDFYANLSGLFTGTTYCYRAVVDDGTTIVYGVEVCFTTLASPAIINPGATISSSACAGYSVELYGVDGLFSTATFGWDSLTLERKVNTPAKAIITIDAREKIPQYLNLDIMVQIWRYNPLLGIDRYKEAELFHRSGKYSWDERAQVQYQSNLVGYEDLLDRRILLGGDDEAYCVNYPAETAMKRMVGVQCNIQGNRQLVYHPMQGLTIDGDLARGPSWTGYRKGAKLLSYLQEIAEAKDMAFSVASPTPGQFVFRAYPNPYGADRTATGINLTTGRNAAGNIPVIFSEQRGNVSSIGYGMMRESEGNVAVDIENSLYVTGTGDTDSPWNHCEFTISTPTGETTANVGATALVATGAWEDVPVTVIQSPACCYGKHYFLGDRVSVFVSIPGVGKVITKVITGMKLTISRTEGQLDEQIQLELSSYARVSRDPMQEALINLTKRLRKVELRV